MNPDLPSCINQWHVEYDPYGFTRNANWLQSAEKTEDILQLAHIYADGPIIDIGYYSGSYLAVVIRDGDWENPHESFSSTSSDAISKWLYSALHRFQNGF